MHPFGQEPGYLIESVLLQHVNCHQKSSECSVADMHTKQNEDGINLHGQQF